MRLYLARLYALVLVGCILSLLILRTSPTFAVVASSLVAVPLAYWDLRRRNLLVLFHNLRLSPLALLSALAAGVLFIGISLSSWL